MRITTTNWTLTIEEPIFYIETATKITKGLLEALLHCDEIDELLIEVETELRHHSPSITAGRGGNHIWIKACGERIIIIKEN